MEFPCLALFFSVSGDLGSLRETLILVLNSYADLVFSDGFASVVSFF